MIKSIDHINMSGTGGCVGVGDSIDCQTAATTTERAGSSVFSQNLVTV
jgi:hypothetical protein